MVCAADSISNDSIGDDTKEILETVPEDIVTDDSADILKTEQNDICSAGEDSFTNLSDEIESKDTVNLTHDYAFSSETDNKNGIVIGKDNFVLNGNGHTIDAKNQSRIFNITKYTITTTYNQKSVENIVTVKQVLKAKKITIKKKAKKFSLKATLKINGKLQKGKTITFKLNGKTYKTKTNKKGIAQKKLNKKIIKKLKKGKKYTVKVTYKKDTIKTTLKVK